MPPLIYTTPKDLIKVTKNLNIALAALVKKNRSGLIAAGKYILEESNKIVPIKYGPLMASGTVIWNKSPKNHNSFDGPHGSIEKGNTKEWVSNVKQKLKSDALKFDVAIGYGASYSVYVHEVEEYVHKNGRKYKFLESALRKKKQILKVIRNHSKIKAGKIIK